MFLPIAVCTSCTGTGERPATDEASREPENRPRVSRAMGDLEELDEPIEEQRDAPEQREVPLRDSPHRTGEKDESRAARPAELALEREVARELESIPGLEAVEVGIRSGIARVSGRASSAGARDEAIRRVSNTAGIHYVDDQLTLASASAGPSEGAASRPTEAAPVAPSNPPSPSAESDLGREDRAIEERLRAIFSSIDELRALRVRVTNGVVRLEGEAASAEAREKAESLARNLPAVVYVDDRVELTADVADRLAPGTSRLLARFRDWLAWLPLFGIAILVFLLFWVLAWLLGRSSYPYRFFSRSQLVRDLVRQVVRSVVILVGVFAALEIMDATALVGAALGAAGIIGLTLGFAFRGIAENYLASILLSFRQPFRAGDQIKVGDATGTVIRMTTRDTVLLTPDGNHLRIPNAVVYNGVLTNFSQSPLRRFDFALGLAPHADAARAQEIGLDVLHRLPGVLADPGPYARLETKGESNLAVRYFGWVDQSGADIDKVTSEGIRFVRARLGEENLASGAELEGSEGQPPSETRLPETSSRSSRRRSTISPKDADVARDFETEERLRLEGARRDEENILEESDERPRDDEIAPEETHRRAEKAAARR